MAEEKKCEKSQVVEEEAPEKEKTEPCEQQTQEAETGEPEAAAEENEVDEAAKLSAELDTLKATIEKMQKDYLLLMAEFDNFRKRTLREKADLIKNGGENCMKAILPVVDDFERGLAAVEKSNDLEAVKEGMNLIYNKFKTYLEQNGVKEIPTQGADFDTEYHEAVTTFPAPDPAQKGKVIDTVQKGYTLNDKVIRFAKVVVGE
ncbi:MAG TPA: nucleotide exchange factor GrpE [Candidatus Barnesiella excrementavium]|nr:nucleotide exchange factor GrpE [Candidatus Barnesiella excrementavium]